MANQATLKQGWRMQVNSPLIDGVLGNLGELAGDVSTLAELQTKLVVIDAKAAAGRAVVPVAILLGGFVLLLGAVPIALFGAADLLADFMGFTHRGWAFLIVAAAAVGVTVVLTLIGWPSLSKSFETLSRSRDELARNIAWIKSAVTNSSRKTGA